VFYFSLLLCLFLACHKLFQSVTTNSTNILWPVVVLLKEIHCTSFPRIITRVVIIIWSPRKEGESIPETDIYLGESCIHSTVSDIIPGSFKVTKPYKINLLTVSKGNLPTWPVNCKIPNSALFLWRHLTKLTPLELAGTPVSLMETAMRQICLFVCPLLQIVQERLA